MQRFRLGASSAVLGLALLAAAPPASAAQYILNVDNCTGGCGLSSYGVIGVTGEGTNTLTVDIQLAPNVIFNEAGGGRSGHDEIWFNTQNASETLGGLSGSFTANGVQNAGAWQPNGSAFGTFDYHVVYQPGTGNPSTPAGGLNHLTYTITGGAPLLEPSTVGPNSLFFVVDVAHYDASNVVSTGHIGATLASIPEPAAWALMIGGFGLAGAALRRRRRLAASA